MDGFTSVSRTTHFGFVWIKPGSAVHNRKGMAVQTAGDGRSNVMGAVVVQDGENWLIHIRPGYVHFAPVAKVNTIVAYAKSGVGLCQGKVVKACSLGYSVARNCDPKTIDFVHAASVCRMSDIP